MERFFDHTRDIGGFHHQVVVLGNRQRDAGNVDLLKRVGSDSRPRHLSRDDDKRNRVHVRGGDACHKVRGARARRRPNHAGAALDASIAVGRVRRALLVPDENVPKLRIFRERLIERQHRAAWNAENNVHTFTE